MKLINSVALGLAIASPLVAAEKDFDEVDVFDNVGCVLSNFNGGTCDFFLDQNPVDNELFSISYHGTFKLITNKVEEQNFAATEQVYVAFQCGTKKPSDSALKKLGVDPATALFVQVPLTSTGTGYQQIHPFFEQLKVETTVDFFAGNASFAACSTFGADFEICADCLFEEQQQDFWQSTKLAPVFFRDAFVTLFEFESDGEQFTAIRVTNDDTVQDQTFEQKASWLTYIGAFFNQESLAFEQAQRSISELECVQNVVKGLPTVTADNQKTILMITSFFDEEFGLPNCQEHTFHCNFVQIADPNAKIIQLSELTNDFSLTLEELKTVIANHSLVVDKLIYLDYPVRLDKWDGLGFPVGPEELNPPQLTDLVDFLTDLHGNSTGRFDFAAFVIPDTDPWFNLRPAVPHLVIQDFVQMVSPERLENVPSLAEIGFEDGLFLFEAFPNDATFDFLLDDINVCQKFAEPRTCVGANVVEIVPLNQSADGVVRDIVECSSAFRAINGVASIFAVGFAVFVAVVSTAI